jgi:hypothetical protein
VQVSVPEVLWLQKHYHTGGEDNEEMKNNDRNSCDFCPREYKILLIKRKIITHCLRRPEF